MFFHKPISFHGFSGKRGPAFSLIFTITKRSLPCTTFTGIFITSLSLKGHWYEASYQPSFNGTTFTVGIVRYEMLLACKMMS